VARHATAYYSALSKNKFYQSDNIDEPGEQSAG
jgi:hypothetical protein